MANLDTEQKRISGIAVSSPWRSILPPPSGSVTSADRQQVPYYYSGIAANPPNPNIGSQWYWQWWRHRRMA